ncbi:MAG TPA: carboxypeptidase-like regulatory domain-containing protein [Planctomycetota bacterium]|nr:carboxypeptidase-like regulatory domain-containing protein [Planctomycetota bacterium]
MTSRPRFLVPAILVAVAVVGVFAAAWLAGRTSDERGEPHGTGGASSLASAPDGSPALASGDTMRAASRPGAPAAGGHRRASDASEIAARGKVEPADPLRLAAIQIGLYDAFGEIQSTAMPGPSGDFELRYGRILAEGWSVSTFPAPRKAGAPQVPPPAPAACIDLPLHRPEDPPVECKLVLPSAATIAGRVLDRATGQPVDDADIFVTSALPAWRTDLEVATVDEDGTFVVEVTSFPPRSMWIGCRATERPAALVGPIDVAPGESRTVDLLMDGTTPLHGRVIDQASGAPIAGAEVTLSGDAFAFVTDTTSTQTEDDGTFEFESVELPFDVLRVTATAEGHAPASAQPRTGGAFVEIQLVAASPIGGRVVDEAGAPVEDAEVRLLHAFQWSWGDDASFDSTSTESNGTFSLTPETVPPDADAVIAVMSDGHQAFHVKLRELPKGAPIVLKSDGAIESRPATK